MKHNIMIDIETLGTEPRSAVVSIGAVEFSAMGTGGEFYEVVDLKSAMASGQVDAGTLKWWLKQGAANSVWSVEGEDLRLVLARFSMWLGNICDKKDLQIWANAPSFDCTILRHAFSESGLPVPWNYWNERDHRTLKNLWPVKYNPSGIKHNALDDARNQACHAIKICSMYQVLL